MIHKLLQNELKLMLVEDDDEGLREFAVGLHPVSVAEALEDLPDDDVWSLFARAPLSNQAEIFGFLPLDQQERLVEGAGRERMSRLIEAMPSDERASLLRRLDGRVVESLLPLVEQAKRNDIRTLLSFEEGSAGSLMTTDYASVPETVSAEEAIGLLRRQAPNRETIYYVYVLDEERRLIGMVTVRQLLTARSTAKVADLMRRDPVSISVNADQEDAARALAKFNFIAIPVVDDDKRLVGIITHDDVIDVLEEEATEDVHRMGAVGPIDEEYLDAGFVDVWRKRVVWLSCLFVAELFTFSALYFFEASLDKAVVLGLFIPLVMSTGGNSGSQAATLICRAMALGQVTANDWFRVVRKELFMGLTLGLSLGLIGALRAYFTPEGAFAERPHTEYVRVAVTRPQLVCVIGFSVAAICVWGSLVGSILPMIFSRIGVDPGYASSPFVATFVDVTGIVLYFSIACSFIPGLI
jgi:magnesium transporter